jgi:PAS domain S-box-containing protein
MAALRVLIVEDNDDDTLLLLAELRRGGFEPQYRRVDNEAAMQAALAEGEWQAVLADHQMPEFSALAALRTLQASGLDLPFIIVSGVIDEATAVAAMKAGAHDFVVKGNLARLTPALARELREADLRRRRVAAEAALQAVQRRFRHLVEQIAVVVFEAQEGRLVYVSPQIENLLGYSPAEWLGAPDIWERCLHPDDRERVKADFDRPRTPGEAYQAEYRLVARDGRAVWVLDETRPLGGEGSFIGVYVDITARKEAEQALVRSERELRVMSDQLALAARRAALGELAASVAHQLNNPLALLSLRLEQLRARAAPGAPEGEWLAEMEAASERMGQLVANLLNDDDRRVRQITTLDLCEEAGRALEFVRFPMSLRNVTCALECAEGVPSLRGDRQDLRQVLMHLFNNAGEAMPEGGTLTVRVQAAELGGQAAVAVEVADTGMGIAPEDLPRVWDTFYSTRPSRSGAGLGLPVSRRLVAEHGGTIELSSTVGQGTTARIVLPVRPGQPADLLPEDDN